MADESPKMRSEVDEAEELPASAKIKYQATHDREEVANYLQSILSGLREGHLELRAGSDVVRMRPTDRFDVEVRATRKDGTTRLRIELAWGNEKD